MKLYILVREDIGIGHSVNCVAHASMKAYMQWQNDPTFREWLSSFKKVTCKVSRRKFEEAKSYGDYILVSEDVLNHTEVAMIFKPREDWPDFFKELRLFS